MLAILLAFWAALCFGSGAVFVRLGLQQMKSSVGALLSVMASFAIIATLALILNLDDILALHPIAFLWFILLGLVNYPLGLVLTFANVSLVGASRTHPSWLPHLSSPPSSPSHSWERGQPSSSQ